ncbi:protein of unknown function [Kyrpidia spormannii]|uniref:Uncharacterized protein n=1 Tax=Kyrpidia spormannii TaxID=2055160 RepID=A0A6F9E2E0_9BACL|nr:protein of unknown function [Kyrpidia spormannii]
MTLQMEYCTLFAREFRQPMRPGVPCRERGLGYRSEGRCFDAVTRRRKAGSGEFRAGSRRREAGGGPGRFRPGAAIGGGRPPGRSEAG